MAKHKKDEGGYEQLQDYPDTPENKALLRRVMELYEQSDVGQQLSGNTIPIMLLAVNTIARAILRVTQQDDLKAAEDPNLQEMVRTRTNTFKEYLIKYDDMGETKADTIARDTQRFLRDAIRKELGLGR